MNKIRQFLSAINPFSSRESSKAQYVIRKLMAFGLIYCAAAALGEAVILLGFSALGYRNVLRGELPDHWIVAMLPLFGFVVYILMTFLYVKRIEKRPLADMMLHPGARGLLLFAAFLGTGMLWVALVMGGFMATGVYSFAGFGSVSVTTAAWLFAYIIQGSGEELMCRGFLQNALERRVSRPVAIAFSAIVFILPHGFGLMEMGALPRLVSVLNLALVSAVFSLLMIKTRSVLASCALHAGWNFALGTVFGVNVSGMEVSGGLIRMTAMAAPELLTGGIYGIEASILLTPVLFFAAAICLLSIRKRERNGAR